MKHCKMAPVFLTIIILTLLSTGCYRREVRERTPLPKSFTGIVLDKQSKALEDGGIVYIATVQLEDDSSMAVKISSQTYQELRTGRCYKLSYQVSWIFDSSYNVHDTYTRATLCEDVGDEEDPTGSGPTKNELILTILLVGLGLIPIFLWMRWSGYRAKERDKKRDEPCQKVK